MPVVLFNDSIHPIEIDIEPFDDSIGSSRFSDGDVRAVLEDNGTYAVEDLGSRA